MFGTFIDGLGGFGGRLGVGGRRIRPRVLRAAGVAVVAGWVLAAAPSASGQTIVVDTSSDVIDFPLPRTVAELPGPDGRISLREAGLASDNTAGVQTIAFNVPEAEWEFQWLHPGCVVLNPFLGFRVFDAAIIDGTTQTAFTGDTNPNGAEVVIMSGSLYLIDNLGGAARGFHASTISVSGGSGSTVEGNTSVNIELFDTTDTLITGNTGGTIKIDRASDNVVVGNTVQRVRVLGFGSGNPAANNRIGGPDPADRNFITGYGTINGEGLPGGTTVQLFDTAGTIIENNSIGTTPDGLAQGSLASVVGIGFEASNDDVVIRDNRIAGILGHGTGPHHAGELWGWSILISGTGDGVEITDNTIGLDANGDPVLGSVWGIDVGNPVTNPSSVAGITIANNEIAGHLLNGITIGHAVDAVRLSANGVHDNGWLGIDLVPDTYGYGVTPNDPLDGDAGGNGLQNFPELVSAAREGAAVRVTGALHSAPVSAYTIELFASPACEDDGFGEGQTFLGAASATTDGAGDASFETLLPVTVADGWVITATATIEPLGATSEFSACIPIEDGPMPGDVDANGVVDVMDLVELIVAWGPCDDPLDCRADIDGNGMVDVFDLVTLIMNWS